MSNSIFKPKIRKYIPSIISFGMITLYSIPASAAQLIEPFELFNIDFDNSSEINPPPSPFNNQGNPNSSNFNSGGGSGGSGNSGGGSSSPFVSSQSSPDSSNNNSSDGTEINDIIPSGFNEDFADLIPQDSQIIDLMTVTSMLQPNGNNLDGILDNLGTNNPDTDNPSTNNSDADDLGTVTPTSTPIPEPTSVTALAMIGLVGVLVKQNRSDRS